MYLYYVIKYLKYNEPGIKDIAGRLHG